MDFAWIKNQINKQLPKNQSKCKVYNRLEMAWNKYRFNKVIGEAEWIPNHRVGYLLLWEWVEFEFLCLVTYRKVHCCLNLGPELIKRATASAGIFVPNCSYIGLLVLHRIGNHLEQSRSCVLLLALQKADPSSDAFNTVPLLLKVYVASLVGCASLFHSSLTQAFCTPYSGMWTLFCSDRNTSEIQNLSDFLCFRRNSVNLVN